MQFEDSYPVVVTPHHQACRDFYVRWFGYEVAFEASWFTLIALPGDSPRTLAFMSPEHPSSPPGPGAFSGEGMFLTFQVADAKTAYEELREAGAEFAYDLSDESWGQRRFALRDPAGTWVDVVEQIEPEPGFWEPYVHE